MYVNRNKYIGFEVFTAVVMKSNIFWDMTPCSHLDVVGGPSTPHDPESDAGGSLSAWQGHPSR
jgi:hypothetical protein